MKQLKTKEAYNKHQSSRISWCFLSYLLTKFFFFFDQSEKRNSKDVCSDVWVGRGGFRIFGFCSSQLSDMVFVQWLTDSQTVILFTLLRSCQTNTMPTKLLILTLLGILYSHGNAMSQEEKRKFRWVEKTIEQVNVLFSPRGISGDWPLFFFPLKEPSGWDVWPCLSELYGELSFKNTQTCNRFFFSGKQ